VATAKLPTGLIKPGSTALPLEGEAIVVASRKDGHCHKLDLPSEIMRFEPKYPFTEQTNFVFQF